MSQPEPIDRNQPNRIDSFRPEAVRSDLPGGAESPRLPEVREVPARAMGAPLPVGSGGSSLQEGTSLRTVPPPGRALNGAQADESSGMHRAMSVLKQAMPFVQRLLPLIDGNIVAAVSNLLSPNPHAQAPAQKLDLAPLENQLAELQGQHHGLLEQVAEQNTSLKRVEDQLELVREATDRNTLEQQELIEDLKAMGSKVNLFAFLMFGMLIVSILLNLALFLHIQRVLP